MRTVSIALLGLAFAATALPGVAATPAPARTPYRIDVTKIQPKSLLPKSRLHDDFIVAINRKGQVTRVLSGHRSGNTLFDEHMYGNALQMFIRTENGGAIVGKYRINYDYNPQTARIRRTIALVQTGGVDPNAVGAVYDLLKHAHKDPAPIYTPPPNANLNNDDLPALNEVFGTASPTPKPR